MIYSADFETTTDIKDCRVWAWGMCDVENPEETFTYGNTLDNFFDFLFSKKENNIYYFHNLKFDGEFILNWLFKNGWEHIKDRNDLEEKKFTTLISDKGMFYSIEICYGKNSKGKKLIKIYDSLKVLPFSVEQMAKTFDLPMRKLEIDYNEYREYGHILTQKEILYLKNDVVIVAHALKKLFEQNLTKMTIGSNALNSFKELFGKKSFEKTFPEVIYDSDIRQAYRGGFTYLSDRFAEQDIGKGIVLDVNSLYPSVMYERFLPYGEGRFFEGKYVEDIHYPLYIQMLSCCFDLKKNMIPTIQLKHTLAFVPTEYLKSSNGECVTLCMTNIDLKLFFEHYEVYNIEYLSGWKFHASNTCFREYIDTWNTVKVEATKTGNKGLRTIAKLMLNNLYGKFALNPIVRSKIPYLGEDNIVHYAIGEKETRKGIYIPVGVFVTSWARYKTITSAQSVYDRFIYADTDSLHLVGTDLPENLEISDTKLGAWKLESQFIRARFLRQKSYIEDTVQNEKEIEKFIKENPDLIHHVNYETNSILKITSAGMPNGCYKFVSWDNFKSGNSFAGKLKINHVDGGIVFTEQPHTLKKVR